MSDGPLVELFMRPARENAAGEFEGIRHCADPVCLHLVYGFPGAHCTTCEEDANDKAE